MKERKERKKDWKKRKERKRESEKGRRREEKKERKPVAQRQNEVSSSLVLHL